MIHRLEGREGSPFVIKPMRTSDSDQVGALFPSSIAKKDQFHSPNDHTLSLVTSDLHEVPHRLGIPSSQWEFGLFRLFFTENKTDLFSFQPRVLEEKAQLLRYELL